MKFFSNGPPTMGKLQDLRRDLRESMMAGEAYWAHLLSIADRLPQDTRAFALAEWYNNPRHHDCPHDSWLLGIHMSADHRSATRQLDGTIELLGAYHDRILTISYRNIIEFKIEGCVAEETVLGDWLQDEIDIVGNDYISHEINWDRGANWRIVAKGISFEARDR